MVVVVITVCKLASLAFDAFIGGGACTSSAIYEKTFIASVIGMLLDRMANRARMQHGRVL